MPRGRGADEDRDARKAVGGEVSRTSGTEPVPTEPYVSDEHYELERERIFRRCWINVGRVDEIPNPGDYFVRDIAICKTSVLIIRGSDGVVRGFFNVCSHRGNTLVLDGRGTCPGSVYCHFHNWVYSDTGELIRVPDEENFLRFRQARPRTHASQHGFLGGLRLRSPGI